MPDPLNNDLGFYIRRGDDERFSSNIKFGANASHVTAWRAIWAAGVNFIPMQTPQLFDIVSSSVQDAVGGTGASQVNVTYLDSAGHERNIIVTLTGTTTVTGFATGYGINRAYVIGAYGSSGSNVGNITITEQGASTVQGYIVATAGQTEQCIYRVPSGHVCYLDGYTMSADSAQTTDFRGIFQIGLSTGFGSLGPRRVGVTHYGVSSVATVPSRVWREYPAGTLLIFEAKLQAGTGGVSAQFELILERL